MKFEARFSPGDSVRLKDGDSSLTATITRICWGGAGFLQYEISWIHNGDIKSAWVDDWRVIP